MDVADQGSECPSSLPVPLHAAVGGIADAHIAPALRAGHWRRGQGRQGGAALLPPGQGRDDEILLGVTGPRARAAVLHNEGGEQSGRHTFSCGLKISTIVAKNTLLFLQTKPDRK